MSGKKMCSAISKETSSTSKNLNRYFEKIAFSIFILLLALLSAPLTTAQGCCFNPEDGFCTANSEESSCEELGGEFYDSPSCAVADCERGCCVLGTNGLFVTSRSCEILSRSHGVEKNFQETTEEECYALAQSQDTGACVYKGDYENTCAYISRGECTGEFHEGILCSAEELDTICKRITETICYNEDAYYIDSCGNPDSLKEDCNFATGTICTAGRLSGAYCKSLNCAGGRRNGESWCSFEGTEYLNINEIYTDDELSGAPVGSRFLRKYCLNGDIITEPCADYRMEYCIQGTCEINKGDECFLANTADEDTGKIEIDEEACDSEYCYKRVPFDCVITNDGLRYCGSARDAYKENPSGGGNEETSEAMKSLGLEMCVPKIPIGIDLSQSLQTSRTEEANSICAYGDFEAELQFGYHGGTKGGMFGMFASADNKWYYYPPAGMNYGYIILAKFASAVGLKEPPYEPWIIYKYLIYPGVHHLINDVFEKASESKSLEINPMVPLRLGERCRAISDCDGKINVLGKAGAASAGTDSSELELKGGWSRDPIFTFSFECKEYRALAGSADCGKCGSDDVPCTEYRCEALGKACKYYELEGADRGYCAGSDDRSAPQITSHNLNPQSPIPPFTSVEITVNTNEISSCKFNLGSGQGNYDEMGYSFGGDWTTEHKVRLNIPGKIPGQEEATIYNLITGDGKYEMYVRCEDPAGNYNINAYYIEFEVDPTPDTIPPVILKFEPVSGSPVKYNTTSKAIRFELNEPAECKWSKTDKVFADMENNFECDDIISDQGLIKGYWCSGALAGVDSTIGSQTKYYIRCEDQPWLEGNESGLYKRNTNTKSKEYVLKPSIALEITELTPKGEIKKSGADTSVELKATTAGGGYNGNADCIWRLIKDTGFDSFENTGGTVHTQKTSMLEDGKYKLEARCNDKAGNTAEATSDFELEIDDKAPKVVRAYKSEGNLKIITNEEAICKYSINRTDTCRFNFETGAEMQGASKEHTVAWVDGQSYYIKCRDYRGNENTGCGIIVKTY